MRSPASLALATLLLVALPESSSGAWLPDGNLVTDRGGTKERPFIVGDGEGGVIIAWTHSRNIHAQRLSAAADYYQGWTSLGVPVCTAADDQFLVGAIPDGAGGVYLVWEDTRDWATNNVDLYLHRVLPDGSIAPGWPPNGLAVVALPGRQMAPVLAPDGQGGVFVAWSDDRNPGTAPDVYVQHIATDGQVSLGWPSAGLPVCSTPDLQVAPRIVADHSGGAYVSWSDTRFWSSSVSDIFLSRLQADGSRHPGWPPEGVRVGDCPGGQDPSELVLDNDGGVIVAFNDFRTASSADPFADSHSNVYCMRMTADGAPHPDWPSDGLAICTAPQTQQAMQLAPDGAGGLYLAWQDNRDSDYDVYLQRVQPDATLSPGWPANGLRPLPSLPGFQLSPHLAPDGAGGVYLSINNLTDVYQVHTQHMTRSGVQAAGWPDCGQPASAIETDEDESQITADGFGGAIVVWKDFRNQRDDLYAKRLTPPGPTATLVSLQSATAEPGLAKLAWLVTGDASLRATIERRTEASDWAALAAVIADGNGRIAHDDATVEPGGRYAYRLRYADGEEERTTPEAWLDVPARYELALGGFRPNPATRGDLTVAFTLPSQAAGSLELLDVAGRRVASRDLSSLGAGRQTLRLDQAGRAKAGVYWLRLVHGDRVLTVRGIVVR